MSSVNELERDTYDVVVIGTGLAESIAAAALAKAGKTVLHLDPNEYYAASQASLTLDELVEWSSRHSASSPAASDGEISLFSSASTSTLSPQLEANRRRYALSLFPAVLPSRGQLIDTLIKSDVSKYVSFRMLDSVSIWNDSPAKGDEGDAGDIARGSVTRVPGSKEEVFKDKTASLMEKRRLMKFLMFAAGAFEDDPLLNGKEEAPLKQFLEESFSLPPHLSTSVTYAIAHCTSPSDATVPALLRSRRYLKSVGRYGAGAFLVGQYGGAGEVAQGFCRACAVFGGTYVLGASSIPRSIDVRENSVELQLPCHPRPVTASHLISSPIHIPPTERPLSKRTQSIARCIAVLNELPAALKKPKSSQELPSLDAGQEDGEEESSEDDTAIFLFPPTTEGSSVVRGLLMGEGTGSCPAGQYVLYLNTPVARSADPMTILEPYLKRIAPEALFTSYHLTHHQLPVDSPSGSSAASPVVVLAPYAGTEGLTEGLDWEADQGRRAYEKIMENGQEIKEFFEKGEEDEGEEGPEEGDEL